MLKILATPLRLATRNLKTRSVAALALGTAVVLATQSYADSTFLLQLGTFKSQKMASQKWQEVQTKNGDVVGRLKLHIAEVALPPSNTTTYRTQAGPIASREEAGTLCEALQSRGQECYVVETALFSSDTQPVSSDMADSTLDTTTADQYALESAAAQRSTVVPPSADEPNPVYAQEVASAAPASGNDPRMVPGREPRFLMAPPAAAASQSYAMPAPEPVTAQVEEEKTPAPAKTSEPVVAAAAPSVSVDPNAPGAIEEDNSPGFFSRIFGRSHTEENKNADVEVQEAIRVPVTTSQQAVEVPPAPAVPAYVPPAPRVEPAENTAALPPIKPLGGTPSQVMPGSYWAQMSYFRNESDARDFYESFRSAYPQFANGLRMRVVRPYAYAGRPGRVSLRVGPFATVNDVRTICTAAGKKNARCALVRDMGLSSGSATLQRTRGKYLPESRRRSARTSRYQPAPVNSFGESAMRRTLVQPSPAQTAGNSWLQLGTYGSSAEAMSAWKEFQSRYDVLRNMQASVTRPFGSSAATPSFRLRTGPFSSSMDAQNLCNNLRSAGAGCIPVQGR